MSDFGFGGFGGNSIAATIARLLSSPGARYLGNQAKQAAQQTVGRPFQVSNPRSNSGTNIPGATPRLGNILGDVARRAGELAGVNQPQQEQDDPLLDLYEQLIGQLQAPVRMPTGIDTENLMEQVRSAIDPIYNQRSEAAENRTSRAREDVRGMYRALSNDYERLAPEQVAQAKAAQEEIKQLYGQLRSNIEGNYSRVSEEQGELFKQLGIEDALPEALDTQTEMAQEASVAASQNQAQQQQRYMDIGQMDSTYYREGSPLATMTGNEISTDMLAELNDYLNQIDAERTSGIQTAYMDQLNQAQGQLGQQQQLAQSEAARRQEMLWQILQSQLQGNQQQTALTPDTFMSQLPPQVQQAIGGAFTRLQRTPEAIYGKVEDKRNPVPGSFVETTPNWYLAQADEMLRRGEIDATTHQALQMYMQLYFGMGK